MIRAYDFVGVSTDTAGKTKLRMTNDQVTQTKRYKRNGHTNVVFLPLPAPMTKLDAAHHILKLKLINTNFTDAAFRVLNRILPNGNV